MATHYVHLRRLCPSPVGLLTPSLGECSLSMNPTHAQRASSKMRSYLYPSERLRLERPATLELGRGGCPPKRFSHHWDTAAIELGPFFPPVDSQAPSAAIFARIHP